MMLPKPVTKLQSMPNRAVGLKKWMAGLTNSVLLNRCTHRGLRVESFDHKLKTKGEKEENFEPLSEPVAVYWMVGLFKSHEAS